MAKKNIFLVVIIVICTILIFKLCLHNESDSLDSNSSSLTTEEESNGSTTNNTNQSLSSTSSNSKLDKTDKNSSNSILDKDKNNQNTESTSSSLDPSNSSYTRSDFIKEVMESLSQKIKLQSFSLSNSISGSNNRNKTINLVFKTLSEPSCHLGDIDAINFDNAKNPEVLVSVEDILSTEDNLYPIINRVSIKDLEHTTLYFNIPHQSSAQLAGLFICKDSANDRKCNNKASYDISQLLKYYSLTTNITNPSIIKDKIYFFQTLIITSENLYILDTKQTNKNMMDLQKALKQILGTEDSILKSQVQRIKSLNKNVYSKNVVIDKNTITLHLPKQDKEVCNK